MADLRRVKLMRGNESTRTTVIPEQGEQISTIDELKVYLGDGVKSGGYVINADNTITTCLDQANVSTKHSLAWWIAWFNGSDATIRIPKGTHDILTNMTIPSNICLEFDKGAFFNIASGVTLTVNSDIDAGIWEVYTGDGTVDGTAYHPTRPEMPTPEYTDDSDRIATTAFVKDVLSTDPVLDGIPTAPTALYTDDSNQIATTAFVKDVLSTDPALDGIPTAPTADPDTNTTQIATTAYADAKVADSITEDVTTIAPSQNAVFDALVLKADLDSPILTGIPEAPTASVGTNTTQIATTAFVKDVFSNSPALDGIPTAPTAVLGTNNTQIANTSYVKTEINAVLAASDVLIFKGTLGTSGTITELPITDYKIGWAYKIITAGTYANKVCEIGDMIISIVDFDTIPNDSDWIVIQTNLDGSVIGPVSSTTDNIALFDGITGKLIKDSSKSLSDLATSTHVHGNITNDGKIGIVSGLMIKTSTNGELIALTAGTSGQYLQYDGTWSTPPDTDTVYTHPTSGVSAGTYTSVTVDTNGHVTTGTNPTTLSGYGITDAAPLASPTFTGDVIVPDQTAGNNSTKAANTKYVDAKVADAINDGVTGIAPSQNAVFDALALKADLADTNALSLVVADNQLRLSDHDNLLRGYNPTGAERVDIDSTARSVSLPLNVAESGLNVLQGGMTLTNLITNGDFSDGTTGWTYFYGTIAVADNICEYSVVTPSGSARIEKINGIPSFTAGHKYFAKYSIKATIDTTTKVYLGNGWTVNPAIVANVWYSYIAIKTVTSNVELGFYCDTTAMSVGDKVYYKDVELIDLTAHGLDSLTVSQVDALVAAGYFSGTKSATATRIKVVDTDDAHPTYQYVEPLPLRRLEDGTRDTIENGAHIQRVSDDGTEALATPVITYGVATGVPIAYPNGTITLEPVLADVGYYTDKFEISRTGYPVVSLETLSIVDLATGQLTPLDASTAVIAENGLSFTHADLTAGNLVDVTYVWNYDGVYGENTFGYLDSTVVKADTANSKFYKAVPSFTNGVLTWTAEEVI